MKLSGRKTLYLSIFTIVLAVAVVFFAVKNNNNQQVSDNNQEPAVKPIDANTEIVNQIPLEALPETKTFKDLVEKVERKVAAVNDTYFSKPNVLLDVAFASQAPFGVWDDLHGEACEEASMIIVDRYFDQKPLDNNIMEQEIQAQVKWQTENGYDIDITIRQTQDILKTYYKIENTELIANPTAEDLKKQLSQGKLVIFPAAGRQLGNPYYTPPGPVYHMLVIIGYDDAQREFITNDPGTKRGASYRYDYDVLLNAIHDWNNGDVANGAKVVLAVGMNK